jgi:hypothetical protein
MQNQVLASQVHEIFSRGLDLHERLERGDAPDFHTEHDRIRKLLWGEGEAAANPEYSGAIAIGSRGTASFDPNSSFLGARYALACWLDELFVLHTPWAPDWSDQWKENMMEVEVVGTGSGEAAWRFWQQAKRAGTRPGTDALEVYLWCVMLGFRGAPESEGVDSQKWADSTRKHIIQSRNQRFPHDAGGNPRPDVDILTGRKQLLLMLRIGVVVLAAAAFLLGRMVL